MFDYLTKRQKPSFNNIKKNKKKIIIYLINDMNTSDALGSSTVSNPVPFSVFNGSKSFVAPFGHVPASQTLFSPTGGSVSSVQLAAPLLLTSTANNTWYLPSAEEIMSGYPRKGVGVPSGSFYSVPVYNIGAGQGTFVAGAGGSGSVTVPAYQASTFVGNGIGLRWTSVPPNSPTYTLF